MTATAVPGLTVDTRATDALTALLRQAARPENTGLDRAVVRRAARILRGQR